MPAPSKTWVTIADSQVDADSPIDTVLMTRLRDDVVLLREWLGKDFTAMQNHDHDNINSKKIGGDVSFSPQGNPVNHGDERCRRRVKHGSR